MEMATPGGYSVSQLARLNCELEDLYELIYDDLVRLPNRTMLFLAGSWICL